LSTDLLLQKLRVLFEALPAANKADTTAFKSITHEQYLERLKHWLELHRDWFGESLRIAIVHGGDEEGGDLVVEFGQSGVKVCFQFKSYNDFDKGSPADFTGKVVNQTLKAANAYDASEVHLIFGASLGSKKHRAKIQAVERQLVKSADVIKVTVRRLLPQRALTLYQQPNTLVDTSELERLLGRDMDAFLRELGHAGELWKSVSTLGHIESLYVPPTQFEEIKSVLQRRHLVCIVGEPHMGKTYTALYLLLTYYRNGYVPRWEMEIPDIDALDELSLRERYRRSEYRDKWDFGRFVEPGQVVYIEDPFGKTSEEEWRFAISWRGFDLSGLLEAVKDRAAKGGDKPPKVIITSRQAVFQRAVEVQPELKDLIVEIRKDVSYDVMKRRDILQRYIEFFEPKWAENEAIAQRMIDQVPDELLAPHNIYLFVNRSREQVDLEAVPQEVEKAKKIVPALAADIALLPPLSQLVFVTIYVTSFEPAFQRFPSWRSPLWGCFDDYQVFAETLGYETTEAQDSFKSTMANWDSVLAAIELDKIGTTEQRFVAARFLHPSIAEATAQFIAQGGPRGIFSQLCLKIQELYSDTQTRSSATQLIHPLIAHFESLPPRNLDQIKSLFRNGDESVRAMIVEALLANYDRLTPPLREFFDELDPDKDEEIWYLFMQAAFPNPRLSSAQSQELWKKALGQGTIHGPRPSLGGHPMDGPILFYHRLPTELQQIILNHLESRNQFHWYCLACPLIEHYEHVPSQLQQWVPILASEGNEYVVYEIMRGLSSRYERLPSDIQDLTEYFGTAPNWKCRAYIAQMFWDRLDHLKPTHAELVRRLALQDSDGRVRISIVYSHLMLATMHERWDLSERDLRVFDELFYSEDPENKAGVLLSLFNTSGYWRDTIEKEKYEERFAELVASDEPLVVAMLRYRIPRANYPPGLIQRSTVSLPDSEIDQYEDAVNSLADGLESVAWGPRGK
jgi:hypothetical protein